MDRRPGCCTRFRGSIRKCVKEKKSKLLDITALIARLTVISMIVSCGVDGYTAMNSVRCQDISVEFPQVSLFLLACTGLMVSALVVCKFLEHEEEPVRVSRILALGSYFLGIFALITRWASFTDKLCGEYGQAGFKLFSNHSVELRTARSVVYTPTAYSRICKKYIVVDKDCGRQYLRQERNVIFFFCAIFWCILTFICYWYLIHIKKRAQALGVRLSGRNSDDQTPNSSEDELLEMQEEVGASPPAAQIAVATIEHQGQPGLDDPDLSRPGCSTGPSNAEDGFEEIDLRKLAYLDEKTGECTYCHALNRTKIEGKSKSVSFLDELSKKGGLRVRFSKDEKAEKVQDTPKYCQNCGCRFHNKEFFI